MKVNNAVANSLPNNFGREYLDSSKQKKNIYPRSPDYPINYSPNKLNSLNSLISLNSVNPFNSSKPTDPNNFMHSVNSLISLNNSNTSNVINPINSLSSQNSKNSIYSNNSSSVPISNMLYKKQSSPKLLGIEENLQNELYSERMRNINAANKFEQSKEFQTFINVENSHLQNLKNIKNNKGNINIYDQYENLNSNRINLDLLNKNISHDFKSGQKDRNDQKALALKANQNEMKNSKIDNNFNRSNNSYNYKSFKNFSNASDVSNIRAPQELQEVNFHQDFNDHIPINSIKPIEASEVKNVSSLNEIKNFDPNYYFVFNSNVNKDVVLNRKNESFIISKNDYINNRNKYVPKVYGGCGEPIRDSKGNIIASKRQLSYLSKNPNYDFSQDKMLKGIDGSPNLNQAENQKSNKLFSVLSNVARNYISPDHIPSGNFILDETNQNQFLNRESPNKKSQNIPYIQNFQNSPILSLPNLMSIPKIAPNYNYNSPNFKSIQNLQNLVQNFSRQIKKDRSEDISNFQQFESPQNYKLEPQKQADKLEEFRAELRKQIEEKTRLRQLDKEKKLKEDMYYENRYKEERRKIEQDLKNEQERKRIRIEGYLNRSKER